ncbi:MAG: TetR/AcrR family transcriptional regulator [Microthrixaceae bacterium]
MSDLLVGPTRTRDAILDAAESEFGRLGYSGTTIGGIAGAAEVSRPLVYRYFGDKNALYREVVSRVLVEWHNSLLEVAERRTPTTAHTIGALTAGCLHWVESHPLLRGVLLRDHDVTRRVAGDEIEAGRNRLPALLERVLRSGAQRGDIRSDLDPVDIAWVLTEVIAAGSLASMTAGSDEASNEARVRAMVEVILHGVVVNP